MMEPNSEDVEKELYSLVEELTTCGEKTLSEKHLRQLKKLCKQSDQNVRHVYHLLMIQLEKDHAEIRYSTCQIVDQLFMRSHIFRELLVNDFHHFLELTVETNSELPLPLPVSVAKELKTMVLKSIETWNSKFGAHYKKLELGYSFLQRVKKIDFDGLRTRTVLERRQSEERQRQEALLEKKKQKRVEKEMNETEDEIQLCVTQAENCFLLLFPTPNEIFKTSDDADAETETKQVEDNSLEADADPSDQLKDVESSQPSGSNVGMLSRSYKLTINLPSSNLSLKETPDNTDVLRNLKDLHQQIGHKFLPQVNEWITVLTKGRCSQKKIERAVSLKNMLKGITEKYKELEILPMNKTESRKMIKKDLKMSDSEGDDEFEDVPEVDLDKVQTAGKDLANYKERSQSTHSTHTLTTPCPKQSDKMSPKKDINTPGPSKESSDQPNERKRKLLAKAPILPYDTDLRFWGQSKLDVTPVSKSDSLHRFWTPKEFDEEFIPSGLEESLRSRAITFVGKFEKVKWKCRAPLPNGKLCERQDRLKCPFHGKIIPRNEQGDPEDATSADMEAKSKEAKTKEMEQAEFREVQKDIEAVTGIDLGTERGGDDMKKKRRKGVKNARYARLTDLKKVNNTSRKRLEKAVLSKGAMERVANTLNAIDSRRNFERFGSNWNYHYET